MALAWEKSFKMITMTHIAEKAGVSRATVSLILNGRDSALRISDTTRRRVVEVARENGFRRNELLHSAVSGKNRMIGFLVKSPRPEAPARILDGALMAAEEPGYTIKVMRLSGSQLDHGVINRCVELRLAAVIALYLPRETLETLHAELAAYRIPLAVLDTHTSLGWGVRVDADDVQAFGLAVEHLVSLGHRRIAFVSGVPGQAMSGQREAAFAQAMKKHRLPQGRVVHGHLDRTRTLEVTTSLLESPSRPSAIIGITDAIGMGVLAAARRAGLDVPRDLSVVGYGGASLVEYSDPPLTTVVQPFEEIGKVAVQRLMERAHSEEGTFQDSAHQTLLPARLVVRESTAPESTAPAQGN